MAEFTEKPHRNVGPPHCSWPAPTPPLEAAGPSVSDFPFVFLVTQGAGVCFSPPSLCTQVGISEVLSRTWLSPLTHPGNALFMPRSSHFSFFVAAPVPSSCVCSRGHQGRLDSTQVGACGRGGAHECRFQWTHWL